MGSTGRPTNNTKNIDPPCQYFVDGAPRFENVAVHFTNLAKDMEHIYKISQLHANASIATNGSHACKTAGTDESGKIGSDAIV